MSENRTGAAASAAGRKEAPAATVDAAPLLRLTTAYWSSMVLLAAQRLGVFRRLSDGPRRARQLARACDSSPAAMEMLLNAAVGQGLVEKRDELFSNSPLADAFLVPGRPGYLGDGLAYALDMFPVWGRLVDSVRSGDPAVAPHAVLGGDPERTRHFVRAMHARALSVARGLAGMLDLRGRRRLLDVGGGPGTYSILLAERFPELRSTVIDLPDVVEIAGPIIAESEARDRIDTLAGDYHEVAFPPHRDVVLMSGMLHRETVEGCRRLLAKAFDALDPGGLVVVSDVFFDDEQKTSPPFAALFALNMMLCSRHGSAHARTEVADWVADAGYREIETRPFPPPMPHSVIFGVKRSG